MSWEPPTVFELCLTVAGWLMLAVCAAWGVTRKKPKAPRKPPIIFNPPSSATTPKYPLLRVATSPGAPQW